MKALLVIILGLCTSVSHAQEADTTKTLIQAKELDEVVVKASYLTRQEDHILAIPTKEQRKHALTCYDLLSNIMMPGVTVDCSKGNVTTPAGSATLYIDGREADFREVQSLRPKDISRVEYYDVPVGKYAKDAYAINIVLKPLNSGGKSIRPSLYFYGLHTFSGTKSMDYTFDGYYSRNDHNRFYNEDETSFRSIVKEDYYYAKANVNYSMSLNHKNRLAFSLFEFLRASDSEYLGISACPQHLLSSETILFADYSQRLGRFFVDFNQGLSLLSYRLKGMKAISHLTPRIQARAAYI